MKSSLTHRAKWIALALLAVTQFVLILDAAIVNVALPSIGRALDFTRADLSWVTNAYTLVFGGFLLLGGRLADIAGRRRLFIAGLGLFTVASLTGALAQSSLWLVLARAAQGLGAALVSPAALSLVMTLFADGAERNRALGIWGAMAGSGAAAGSILGGVLTEWLGWQSVLYVNVPIGLAAIALAPRLLPEARDPGAARSFDIAGAVSVTGGLALLAYALVDANNAGWGSAQTIGLGAVAIALIIGFVAIERRAVRPLVPLRVFGRGTLRGANAVAALTTVVMFPMFFFLTLYLQQVLGYEPLQAGLGQLPIALTILLAAGPVSQLVTRVGYRAPLVAGLVVIAAGMAWLSQISAPHGAYFTEVFGPAVVLGLGGALAWISVTIAATSGAARDEAGLASGLINTSQQMGGALGLAILIAVATARTNTLAGAGRLPAVALTGGFQTALLAGSAIALVSALLAAVLLSPRARRAPSEAAQPAEIAPSAAA
jgi:EmrB/QacA subfamily drug resistance transporter